MPARSEPFGRSMRWATATPMMHRMATDSAFALTPSSTRITASIGVEVHGVDLRGDVDEGVVRLLRTAVAAHHVVILRDQFLAAQQHATVASAFGPILSSPVQIATRAITDGGAVSTIED